MDSSARYSAAIAYIPVIGWLYVLLAQRRNAFAMFHVKQAIGLVVFLIASLLVWAVFTWIISQVPYGFLVGNAFFTIVILAYLYGIFAWVIGIINALRGRTALLPVFGAIANRL
jgi:uncharacterized membrane protein